MHLSAICSTHGAVDRRFRNSTSAPRRGIPVLHVFVYSRVPFIYGTDEYLSIAVVWHVVGTSGLIRQGRHLQGYMAVLCHQDSKHHPLPHTCTKTVPGLLSQASIFSTRGSRALLALLVLRIDLHLRSVWFLAAGRERTLCDQGARYVLQ